MIDIDELERQAKEAKGDEPIGVHREELLFLIARYRELPDLTPEEEGHVDFIKPDVNATYPPVSQGCAHEDNAPQEYPSLQRTLSRTHRDRGSRSIARASS
jgi:hypothetical protein